MKRNVLFVSLAAGSGLIAAAPAALAGPCSALPNTVLVSGSTAIKPLVQQLSALLATATGSDQMTVVVQSSGSCAGVAAIAADTSATTCAAGACLTGTANFYTLSGTTLTTGSCDLDTAGSHIDVALSDVFMTSCAGVDTSALHDTGTVVLPFSFIVPHASSQTAIDTREAYLAYGLGNNDMLTPWNNETFIFQRSATSGSQITVSRSIHVPEGSFLGVSEASGSAMLTAVSSATNTEAAIGFAGSDQVDMQRANLTGLAYRHWGQNNYYWPDSQHTSFDKKNIRDGHYPLWGYEHVVVRSGNARAQLFSDIVSGNHIVPVVNMLNLTISVNLVPQCAMEVSRSTDGGDFSVYTSPAPCSCYFDAHVTGGSTTCATCTGTGQGTCATGQTCSNGYCEAPAF